MQIAFLVGMRCAAPLFTSLFLMQACYTSSLESTEHETLEQTDYDCFLNEEGDRIQGRRGPSVSFDNAKTQVWSVSRDWADKDPTVGMAWPANSGLSWDDKYSAWIGSMKKSGQTFVFSTPFGKNVESPNLECSEMIMFLRIAFANWYELPFFLEASDRGERVFFGHMGIITSNGERWKGYPEYANYPDYSNRKQEIREALSEWPHDENLRKKKIAGSTKDGQNAFSGAHIGTYFDEVFLNKRVGYFLADQFPWVGTVTLADSANSYHVKATSIMTGDYLLKREPGVSTGHTLIIKNIIKHDSTINIANHNVQQLEIETMNGNMPRKQARWSSATSSRGQFLKDSFGAHWKNAAIGAGLNRFRSAMKVGKTWTNVVLQEDEQHWIRHFRKGTKKDYAQLISRSDVFQKLLVVLDPRERINALHHSIEQQREWIRDNPSSCSARTKREEFFVSLYKAGEEINMLKEEIDSQYRTLEDYVFAELDYTSSKTCCWNSSNNNTYRAAMKYNECLLGEANDSECDALHEVDKGICQPIQIFMNRDDSGMGYEAFKRFSITNGYGWASWENSENCSWSNTVEDTPKPQIATPYCQLTTEFPHGC